MPANDPSYNWVENNASSFKQCVAGSVEDTITCLNVNLSFYRNFVTDDDLEDV